MVLNHYPVYCSPDQLAGDIVKILAAFNTITIILLCVLDYPHSKVVMDTLQVDIYIYTCRTYDWSL